MVAGCLVLLGGDPGVGKSTLLVQALAGLASGGRRAVRDRRGVGRADRDAGAAGRRGDRGARPSSPRPTSSGSSRTRRRSRAGGARGRFDPDRVHAAARLDPGLARAGPRVREPADAVREDHRDRRRSSSATSPRTARSPGPRRSSTWSMSCSSSRATAGRTGSCARTRTGSARRRRSACSRCAAPGWPRSRTRRRTCSPSGRSARRARSSSRRPMARGRCSSRSRRWSRRRARAIGRRTAAGVDGNRVSLLLAVLAQRAGCDVLDRDVFVNVAGGATARPSRRSISASRARSRRRRAAARSMPHTIVFGEVGLAGEIRAVPLCEQRLAEAARLGVHARDRCRRQNASRLAARTAAMPSRDRDRAGRSPGRRALAEL